MMRRDQLCPGPWDCPDVLMENPRADRDAPRCEECPLSRLDEYLASPAGQVIQQTIDLDFALQAGVAVSLAEISYPEFLLLRLLVEERNRLHEEVIKKATRHGR
jgi:hypothetical protein